MPEILHRVGIEAPAHHVYRALATRSGLMNWWTWHVKGEPGPGAVVSVRFGDASSAELTVQELSPAEKVRWRCTAGPDPWVGTEITFTLVPAGRETIVSFRHAGWREADETMAHFGTWWAYYLFSLRSWVEDGRGTPYPESRSVSSWG